MTLKEKNDVLRLALDNINYIVTENAGNNPTDIEKQYDCNAFAFDAICKVVADCVRAGLPGSDLPPKTFFTPEAANAFSPIASNPCPSFRTVSAAQSAKAESPIRTSPFFGSVTALRFLHPSKVESAISVIPSGMLILASSLQPMNAASPISVIPFAGRLISFRPMHCSNA